MTALPPAADPEKERRAATLGEARALAHPLRLRILRLCLGTARTNKQLADLLGEKAGSLHHHVRTLVDTGFLEAGEVRQGETGALEKPYRATGKSWTLDVGDHSHVGLAMIDAFRAELLEGGPHPRNRMTRLALTLNDNSWDELRRRVWEVVEEFADRDGDADGVAYSFLVALQRQPVRDDHG